MASQKKPGHTGKARKARKNLAVKGLPGVAGFDYGQPGQVGSQPGQVGSNIIQGPPDDSNPGRSSRDDEATDGSLGGTGSTSRPEATPRRVATKSSDPDILPHPPLPPEISSDSLPDIPSAPSKISHTFEAAAARTAYQIFEDLGRNRSLEMVAEKGGFDLADVTKWSQENHWEEMYKADQSEAASLSMSEGNPVQAIRLRAAMKVDLQRTLELSIQDPEHYGLRPVDRKAIFEMVRQLTDTEVGADKMRPGKIIVLMDRDAYERAKEPRAIQIKEQKDDKLYEEMHAQALAQAAEQKKLLEPVPVHTVDKSPGDGNDPFAI